MLHNGLPLIVMPIPKNTIFIQYRRHADDEERVAHISVSESDYRFTEGQSSTLYEVRNAHGFVWNGQLLRTYDSRKQKHKPKWVLDYVNNILNQ